MCGRVRLSSDVSEIRLVFGIPPDRPTPNFPPSWNVAPTNSLPVVRYDAKAGERSLDILRWGLIPYWAKDINVGFANINAKAEGIESKPAFRKAFERRRCLVPVDNFFEWKKTGTGKQPYAISGHASGFSTAGMRLRSSAHNSFGVVVMIAKERTHSPAGECQFSHKPASAMMPRSASSIWLGEQPADVPQLKSLLAPYPSDGMICWPVSARVGNVRNNDSSLIEPVASA